MGSSAKFMIGQAIHELLESSISKPITIDEILKRIGCSNRPKMSAKITKILLNYKRSRKFKRWLRFFSKYAGNQWKLYIEREIDGLIPDIILVNHKKKRIVVVDIKTGDRTKKKIGKVIVQLYKYYQILKDRFKSYVINLFVFWAKFGEFEPFQHIIAELHSSIRKFHRFYYTKQEVRSDGKVQKPAESSLVFGV